MKPRCGECFKDIANKCNRCGINPRHQEYECCEPCMDELILGQPGRNNAWNRFIEELSDALIRADRRRKQERSERQ